MIPRHIVNNDPKSFAEHVINRVGSAVTFYHLPTVAGDCYYLCSKTNKVKVLHDLTVRQFHDMFKDNSHYYIQTGTYGRYPSMNAVSSPRLISGKPAYFKTGFSPVLQRYNKGALVAEFDFPQSLIGNVDSYMEELPELT